MVWSFHWHCFLSGLEGKVSACNAGEPGSIPELGRSPGEENGNPLQYPCLENPMDGGAWEAAVHGVAKSRTQLSDFTFLSISRTSHFLQMCFPFTQHSFWCWTWPFYCFLKSLKHSIGMYSTLQWRCRLEEHLTHLGILSVKFVKGYSSLWMLISFLWFSLFLLTSGLILPSFLQPINVSFFLSFLNWVIVALQCFVLVLLNDDASKPCVYMWQSHPTPLGRRRAWSWPPCSVQQPRHSYRSSARTCQCHSPESSHPSLLPPRPPLLVSSYHSCPRVISFPTVILVSISRPPSIW